MTTQRSLLNAIGQSENAGKRKQHTSKNLVTSLLIYVAFFLAHPVYRKLEPTSMCTTSTINIPYNINRTYFKEGVSRKYLLYEKQKGSRNVIMLTIIHIFKQGVFRHHHHPLSTVHISFSMHPCVLYVCSSSRRPSVVSL